MPETDNTYDFGGDVGAGWIPIVEELHRQLLRLDPGYRIEQVKEKFGGLRYYYSSDSKNVGNTTQAIMFALVSFAERLSYRTCERCGRPGKMRDDLSWVLTLCDGCHSDQVARLRRDIHDPS